jgi:hypothetical protein
MATPAQPVPNPAHGAWEAFRWLQALIAYVTGQPA